MKVMTILASILALVALGGCNSKQRDATTAIPVKLQQVAPPKDGDWTKVVTATPDGGFMMGNPNAKAKLLEIGSLTCPHCKAFDDEAFPALVDKYVRSGQVSWEFRNYVRDGLDLSAALIVRCNGAQGFFPLMRALYKDQSTWEGKVQATPQAQVQQIQQLPNDQQFVAMAKLGGLQDWAAARGLPQAKSNQCLSNQASIDQLVQMNSDTNTQFPNFPGTPMFAINGEMVDLGHVSADQVWPTLESKLNSAIKG